MKRNKLSYIFLALVLVLFGCEDPNTGKIFDLTFVELDAATTAIIEKGRRNVEILKQGLNQPMSVENQIAIIYCGTKGLLNDISLEKVKDFEVEFLSFIRKEHSGILDDIKKGKLSEEVIQVLEDSCHKIKQNYIS